MNMQEAQEIIGLALEVNGLQKRESRETGNLPTVFVYFSGHVALLKIAIHSGGWGNDSEPDNAFEFYTDYFVTKEKMMAYRTYMNTLIDRINKEIANEKRNL